MRDVTVFLLENLKRCLVWEHDFLALPSCLTYFDSIIFFFEEASSDVYCFSKMWKSLMKSKIIPAVQ